MDQHALHVMEYNKVKELLRELCVSPLGSEQVDALRPFTSAESIRHELSEVDEMIRLTHARQEPPTDGIYDIRDPLTRARVEGAVLDPAEIILIKETAVAARNIRSSVKKITQDTPNIKSICERLVPLPELEQAVDRVFDEQSNLRDNATSELAKIRKTLRQQRSYIVNRLQKIIHGRWKEYLVEHLYTHRENRYVLPVDTRYQNKVKGIIHDRSATHTTVYMEPMELVEDGNLLKDYQRDEQIEINRILRDLTKEITHHLDLLEYNLEIFKHLDFVSAKARFSIRNDFNIPKIQNQGELSIVNGRHPLLLIRDGREKVVPLTLRMPKAVNGLVITGPNTGGKTVVLKTVGLLAMMAQSGIPIPADATSEFLVFQSFGADIGDEQSLEQNLSTFSSHMRNICEVLETADYGSLVFLDELGSGTDPIEGGALACSIMHHLHEKGATFLISTHLHELKLYAHDKEGIENGAMEFDMETLQPTFRFTMGLPGQSNAIQIAARLGVPQDVIERAHEHLKEHKGTPEELLLRLGDEARSAEANRETSQQELQTALRLREESKNRVEKAKREARQIIERAEKKSQNLIQQFERRLKDLERQEKEFQKQWEEKMEWLLKQSRTKTTAENTLKNLKKEFKESKEELQTTQQEKPEDKKSPPVKKYVEKRGWKWEQIKPGLRVKISGIQDEAVVQKVFDKKEEAEVSVASMTLRVKAERIEAILQEKPKPEKDVKYRDVQIDRPSGVSNSLDIHGMTVDEMTPILETYLDKAFRSGLPEVKIVHGHGYGVLRRTVRSMLKEHPLVQHYSGGQDFEGGTGVTIVKLRRAY